MKKREALFLVAVFVFAVVFGALSLSEVGSFSTEEVSTSAAVPSAAAGPRAGAGAGAGEELPVPTPAVKPREGEEEAPPDWGIAGRPRDVDIEKIRRLIRRRVLSEHEAQHYRKAEPVVE